MDDQANELQIHPAANIFPMLPAKELQQLAESIKQHGQREPIALLDGKILDGRNRYAACKLAGVKPRTIVYSGGNPWVFVWNINAERRHLDLGTLGCIKLLQCEGSQKWEAEQAQIKEEGDRARSETQKGKPKQERGGSKRTATSGTHKARNAKAKSAGVSPATIAKAEVLKKNAPDLFRAMSTHAIGSGTCNVSINVPTDERTEIGRLAFRLGFKSVGDLMRALVLKGLEQQDATTAARVREIRRRYYGSGMLAIFLAGLLVGANHELRRASRRVRESREDEITWEAECLY